MFPELASHKRAVVVLYDVRQSFLAEDWEEVYATSFQALLQEQPNEQSDYDSNSVAPVPLPAQCVAELTLARDHTAYLISCGQLCDAIYSNRIEG